MNKRTVISVFFCACALVLTVPVPGWSQAQETIFYFTRHGEDNVELAQLGQSGNQAPITTRNGTPGAGVIECQVESLSPLGEKRAQLLAKWFEEYDLLSDLTHVFSSYKVRTLQTVLPTAQAAGLDLNATDIDKNPGDGVQQLPPFVEECDAGYESPLASIPVFAEELVKVPMGSRVLVCGHSPTLYPIMQLLGIDTSDPVDFPIRPNGKVDGFNNLWIIGMNEAGEAHLKEHLLLDFAILTTVPNPH